MFPHHFPLPQTSRSIFGARASTRRRVEREDDFYYADLSPRQETKSPKLDCKADKSTKSNARTRGATSFSTFDSEHATLKAHTKQLQRTGSQKWNSRDADCIENATTSEEEAKPRSDVIQLIFNNRIHIICTVEHDAVAELKCNLRPLLRKYGARYGFVMHCFRGSAKIEAQLTTYHRGDFLSLGSIISADMTIVGARDARITSYPRAMVQFDCEPLELNSLASALQSLGYKVCDSYYSFIPKNLKILEEEERCDYHALRKRLERWPGVTNVYDDVKF